MEPAVLIMPSILTLTGAGRGGGGAAPTGTAVDVLVRLETGTSGHKMFVADLNSSTLGLGSNTWSLVGTGTYPEWDNAGDQNTPGLSVGGVGYTDPNAGVVRFPLSPQPLADDYCLLTMSPTRANLCLGFMYRFNTATAGFWTYNGVRIDTTAGAFFSLSVDTDGTSTIQIYAHGAANGSNIAASQDKWYWITMSRTNTTSAVVRVYDPASSYSLVGTSTATLSASDAVTAIRFGITDSGSIGGAAAAASIVWDDIAIVYASATFVPAP